MAIKKAVVLDEFNFQQNVIDIITDAARGELSPSKGDRYLLSDGANINKICYYDGADWVYLTSLEGWICWVNDENLFYKFDGTNWQVINTIIKPSANSTTAVQIQNAAGTSILNVDTTNSRIGIRTSAPNYSLHILTTGATDYLIKEISSDNINGFRLKRNKSGGSYNELWSIYQPATSKSLYIEDTSRTHMIIDTNGNVGIGNTAPEVTLDVFDLNGGNGIYFRDTRAYSTPPAQNVVFRLKYNVAGDYFHAGSITCAKDNATVDVYGAHLKFFTRENGVAQLTERMRITSTGLVGIGTTNPLRGLDINEASGNCLRLIYNDANGSPSYYSDFLVGSSGDLTVNASSGIIMTNSIYPMTNDTYYLGKNSISSPLAWKGIILKDTTDGNYYRIEITNGSIIATQIT